MNSQEVAENFIAALEELESGGDVEPIAGLFSKECEIGNVTLSKTLNGVEGAREFWSSYRDTLGEVRSTFRNKVFSDGTAALEWTTESAGEGDISYKGVSILEIEGDKIQRFFAYFDPLKLGNEIGGRSHGEAA